MIVTNQYIKGNNDVMCNASDDYEVPCDISNPALPSQHCLTLKEFHRTKRNSADYEETRLGYTTLHSDNSDYLEPQEKPVKESGYLTAADLGHPTDGYTALNTCAGGGGYPALNSATREAHYTEVMPPQSTPISSTDRPTLDQPSVSIDAKSEEKVHDIPLNIKIVWGVFALAVTAVLLFFIFRGKF